MAVKYEVVGIKEIQKQLGFFQKHKAPQVLRYAVIDTARKAKSRLNKEASKVYDIKKAGFSKAMEISTQRGNVPMATIRVVGKKISLYKFRYASNVKGRGGAAAKGKQLKSSALKPLGSSKLKAFIATMSNKHTGIFIREGRGRKITEIMGSSLPEMIGNEKRVYGVVRPEIQKDLKDAVQRHINRALRGDF